jgi:hypothetical protein
MVRRKNMSGSEKSEQIGEAMQLLEQQKRDLAHLVEKVEKVRLAYRTFASEVNRWKIDPSHPEKVFLLNPVSGERDLASFLFAQSDLAALITERYNAEEALRQTKAKLTGFGITSV